MSLPPVLQRLCATCAGSRLDMSDSTLKSIWQSIQNSSALRRSMCCSAIRPRHRRCLDGRRSEEHTSELQSLMRISYAVFCLKKKKTHCSVKNTYKYTIC